MSDLNTLSKIIPPDIALANKALARSLQQIKRIQETNLPDVAAAITALESSYDLPLIQALDEPIPLSVQQYYTQNYATGTGPRGTLVVDDVIGTAAGTTHNVELPAVTGVLQDLDNDGQLDVLTFDTGNPTSTNNGVYTVMQYALDGEYTTSVGDDPTIYTLTIPAGVYGAGTYGPGFSAGQVATLAFANGLIPVAANLIAAIAAANPIAAQQSNSEFLAMANQLVLEKTNRELAGIDYAEITGNVKSVAMNLASSLHDIGLDTQVGGAASFFENIANLTNLGGQAVIASMREGRNIARLTAVGIQMDTQLPDTPSTVDRATLLPGEPTVAEATQYAQANQ